MNSSNAQLTSHVECLPGPPPAAASLISHRQRGDGTSEKARESADAHLLEVKQGSLGSLTVTVP